MREIVIGLGTGIIRIEEIETEVEAVAGAVVGVGRGTGTGGATEVEAGTGVATGVEAVAGMKRRAVSELLPSPDRPRQEVGQRKEKGIERDRLVQSRSPPRLEEVQVQVKARLQEGRGIETGLLREAPCR